MKYNAKIKWTDDDETTQDVIIKVGDICEDDDEIFFYAESEAEIENLKTDGVNDFIVLSYEKITSQLSEFKIEINERCDLIRKTELIVTAVSLDAAMNIALSAIDSGNDLNEYEDIQLVKRELDESSLTPITNIEYEAMMDAEYHEQWDRQPKADIVLDGCYQIVK
jgi:hypothetical protein